MLSEFSALIVILSVVIFLLMRYKNKPRLFYIITILLSIISFIVFLYLYSNIKELELTEMNGKTLRLLRDISRFNYWGLFLTSIPILIRGLGFDIKKFNFNKDLEELQISSEDSEEVEVNVDLSGENIKRSGRKLKRELKYYYLENKLFINIILGIVILILILVFPFNKYVVNRTLNEREILTTKKFNISVNDSYISNKNRTSINSSYLILKIDVKGKINKYSLNLDEFVIEGKHNKYIPSLKYYHYFSELGVGYKNNKLDTENYKEYLLIYNIKNEDKNSKLELNYLGNDRKIKLNPEILD